MVARRYFCLYKAVGFVHFFACPKKRTKERASAQTPQRACAAKAAKKGYLVSKDSWVGTYLLTHNCRLNALTLLKRKENINCKADLKAIKVFLDFALLERL